MNQEIKDRLEQAAEKYGFRVPYDGTNKFYDEEAIKHFKAGAQTILENPEEWGLMPVHLSKINDIPFLMSDGRKLLHDRVCDHIAEELKKQKAAGKKFISDEEIDELIAKIIREEVR